VRLFAFGWIGHASAATEPRVGDLAPEFALKASNGKTYKISPPPDGALTVSH
jgi:hypothetical protein